MHSRFRGSEGRPGEQDAFAGRLCDILSAGSRAVGRRQSRMGMPAGTRARARLHVMYARIRWQISKTGFHVIRQSASLFCSLQMSAELEERFLSWRVLFSMP
jgi:hypothetical protein